MSNHRNFSLAAFAGSLALASAGLALALRSDLHARAEKRRFSEIDAAWRKAKAAEAVDRRLSALERAAAAKPVEAA